MCKLKKGKASNCPPFLSFINGSDENPDLQIYSGYVPLDFFKCELIDIDIEGLVNNPYLSFCEDFNRDTGELVPKKNRDGRELEYRRIAKFQNLKFTYLPNKNRMFLQGSFHMFYNFGKHNHNEFDLKAFLSVLRRLFNQFEILPRNINLIQLEWGLNALIYYEVNTIIGHCLFHKKKPFEVIKNSPEGRYSQVEHSEYFLKLYNKGLHYKLGFDLLRFERKQRKYSKYSNTYGIGRTLHELMNSNFIGLEETLINDWEDVLFFEPLAAEVPELIKYRDPITWLIFFENRSRTTVKRHLDKLKGECKRRGFNYQQEIKESLLLKLAELRKT